MQGDGGNLVYMQLTIYAANLSLLALFLAGESEKPL